MDRRFLPFVLVTLLMLSPLALAQDNNTTEDTNTTPDAGTPEPTGPQSVTIDLEAVAEGGAFYFRLAGDTKHNPDLNVPAGAQVTVNLKSVSGFHNLHVDGSPASEFVSDGETTTYTFTAPESGSVEYWCDPHKSSGMKGKVVIGGAAPAPAKEAPTELELEAVAEGGAFFFRLKGETARNPTLYVAPGKEITITVTSISGFHNLHVEGFPAGEFVSDGQTTTYKFVAPESGSAQYWCDPHKSSGMVGKIVFGNPPAGGGGTGGESPDVNGPTVDLGTLGHPECAGYLIPQSAAEGNVGGPTVEDYVAKCLAGEGQVETAERASHPADYVIPVSWALVALGVVAVVWVNRSYKP